MKPLVIAALAFAAAPAVHAAVIIDTTTLNGSFENGTGSGAGSTIDSWIPFGSGASIQRISNIATHGTHSAVVGGTSVNLAVNTGYILAANDTLTLSFQAKGMLNSDDGDNIAWRLFYTSDDTIGGTATTIAGADYALPGGAPGSYTTFNLTTPGLTDPGAVGRTLFLSFGAGTGLATDEFARVDNVNLFSNVPEPTAALLLVPAMAGCLLGRNRRK